MRFSYTLATAALLGAGMSLAQSNTTAAASNSSIPTDLSEGCRSFLTTLNTDPKISACTDPLVAATKLYSVTATRTTNSTTSSDLDTTLTELCGDSNGCDSDLIRAYLDSFWQQCHTDLQQGKPRIGGYYDNLYMITPLRNAICSTDTGGNYCLKTIAKAAASTSVVAPSKRSLHADLAKRQAATAAGDDDQLDDLADAVEDESIVAAANNTNTAFLFLSDTTPSSILCSDCAQNILAAYIEFETSIPYGIGLRNSDKLKVQSDIFAAFQRTCGAKAVVAVNTIAGTEEIAQLGAASRGRAATAGLTAAAAMVIGVVMLF